MNSLSSVVYRICLCNWRPKNVRQKSRPDQSIDPPTKPIPVALNRFRFTRAKPASQLIAGTVVAWQCTGGLPLYCHDIDVTTTTVVMSDWPKWLTDVKATDRNKAKLSIVVMRSKLNQILWIKHRIRWSTNSDNNALFSSIHPSIQSVSRVHWTNCGTIHMKIWTRHSKNCSYYQQQVR